MERGRPACALINTAASGLQAWGLRMSQIYVLCIGIVIGIIQQRMRPRFFAHATVDTAVYGYCTEAPSVHTRSHMVSIQFQEQCSYVMADCGLLPRLIPFFEYTFHCTGNFQVDTEPFGG